MHEDFELNFTTPVTFLVGENGSGKSTLLEAIAWALGFNSQGGNRDNSYAEGADGHPLGRALKLSWRQRVTDGFFLRAGDLFQLRDVSGGGGSSFLAYGGKSLHRQSHGEAFLALFENRVEGRHLPARRAGGGAVTRAAADVSQHPASTCLDEGCAVRHRHAFTDPSHPSGATVLSIETVGSAKSATATPSITSSLAIS
jgi:energy-coupling factor transporter ATP-binding protein EcfA2